MAIEQTLAIIKPHAVATKNSGSIIDLIEKNGFTITRMEKRQLSLAEAERFYHVHKAKPFFSELTTNMSSGPSIGMVLEKENAIAAWRTLMGPTNPAQASEGTIRKMFGISIDKNATHGSDAPETAAYEISVIFGGNDKRTPVK